MSLHLYLTSCLDAEDGHPCIWVILELVDELNSFGRRDTAVDADVTNLEERQKETSAFGL